MTSEYYMNFGESQLSEIYDTCNLIVETYCNTHILQSIIQEENSLKICKIAQEIIQDIEDILNEMVT